jgi:pyruvate/2-oxoglutarate dehydrogenase complex dihydrolipoamide acyltransferase (E2) component
MTVNGQPLTKDRKPGIVELMAETEIQLTEELVGGDGEAELAAWLVQDGVRVDRDLAVAEVSTSKAIVEVTAPVAGVLRQLVAVGAVVLVGQAIATITAEA